MILMNKWSKDWPIEPGRYWFYGKCSIYIDQKDLYSVRVVLNALNKPTYIIEGNFLYKSEGAEGWWIKAELPNLPIGDIRGN